MKKITLNMLLASLLVLATLASSGCSVRLLDSLTQNRKSEDEVIESVENCYYQYRDEIERVAKFLYSQDNIKQLCIYSPRRGADYCDARTDTLVQLKEDIFAECKSTDISDEDMELLQSFAACMLANDIGCVNIVDRFLNIGFIGQPISCNYSLFVNADETERQPKDISWINESAQRSLSDNCYIVSTSAFAF